MADNNLTTKEEFLLNPVEEHNITDAAVASFETNLKHPLKVTVPIAPIQDLHGMPNPYPAGASVNLIPDTTDTENGYVAGQYLNEDGTTIANENFYISEYFNVDPSTTYTWSSRDSNSDAPCIWFYDENKNLISGIRAEKQLPKTFNPPEGAVYCRSSQTTYTHQETNPSSTAAYQLEVGSTATAYRRYSNICPIEGLDECRFLSDPKRAGFITWNQRAGLQNNLWGHHNTTTTFDGTKIIMTTNTSAGLKQTWVNFPTNHKIIFKGIIKKESTADGVYIGIYTPGDTGYNQRVFISINEEDVSFAYLLTASRSRTAPTFCLSSSVPRNATLIVDKVQLFDLTEMFGAGNEPATVAAFNALFPNDYYEYNYREETCISAVNGDPHSIIPITFTDPSTGDPMTVYGGSLTLNEDGSADLVSNLIMLNLGNMSIYYSEAHGLAFDSPNNITNKPSLRKGTIYRSIGNKPLSQIKPDNMPDYTFARRTDYKQIYFKDPRFELSNAGAAKAKQALQDQYLIIEKSPITYHFPNVGQLKAFLGQNNIWSDIGNVDVKYLTQNSATGLEYRGDRALELRRRAMIGDAPTIHTTVGSEETGGLANFKSYIKAPVKKIEIPFSPKQDLHGYDHPWPAGGGKNLFDGNYVGQYLSIESGYATAKVYDDSEQMMAIVPISGEMTYTVSRTGGNRFRIAESDHIPTNGESVNVLDYRGDGLTSGTITTSAEAKYLLIHVSSTQTDVQLQVEKGTSVTPWAPYENVCPIEGHDGCEVEQSNENLIDVNPTGTNLKYWYYNTGFLLKAGVTYTLRHNATPNIAVYIQEPTGQRSPDNCITTGNGTRRATCIPSVDTLVCLKTYAASASTYPNDFILSLSIDENANVVAHQGATLPLIFNQAGDHEIMPIQEGTGDPSPENVRPIHQGLTFTRDDDSVLSVYGGTLTVNADGTGKLIEQIYVMSIDKNSTISAASVRTSGILAASYALPYRGANANASMYSHGGIRSRSTSTSNYPAANACACLPYDSETTYVAIGAPEDIQSRAEWITWLEENGPLQIAYPLAEPVTYTLSVAETNRALEALGLTQHIGPLYGGTITINPDGSADVVSEWRKFKPNVSTYFTSGTYSAALLGSNILKDNDRATLVGSNILRGSVADRLKELSSLYGGTREVNQSSTSNGGFAIAPNGRSLVIYDSDTTITEQDMIAKYADLEIAYPLATPQTYHFSNLEQLKVWLGENNFWCDVSDDITVKYWNRG